MTHDDAERSPSPVYGEDLHVGQEYHLGSYTISESEIVEFASAWDPQVFHVNKDAAETAEYGGLIASGVQSIAIYQRLVVRDVFVHWSVIAGRALHEVRFLRPVRPGDRLSGRARVESIDFDDRGRALVTTSGELTNQEGKPVLSMLADAYIRARPTHAP